MSCQYQQVVRGPNLTGFGNLPLFTSAHQVVLPTGINFKTPDSLNSPFFGKSLSIFAPLKSAHRLFVFGGRMRFIRWLPFGWSQPERVFDRLLHTIAAARSMSSANM